MVWFKMREFSYDNYADCEVIHDLMGELAHNWTYGQVINKIINILPENVPVKHQLQRDLVSIQKRYGLVYYKDFNQTWRPPSERKNDFIEINSFYYMVFKSFNCWTNLYPPALLIIRNTSSFFWNKEKCPIKSVWEYSRCD